MRITIVLLLLVSQFITLNAQKHDFNWLFGNSRVNQNNAEVNNILFDFHPQPVEVFNIDTADLQFYFQRAAVSDFEGNLLFYSNGCDIQNAAHQIMENGDSLNVGETHDYYCDVEEGWGVFPGSVQSMLALPQPKHDSIWYLFHIGYNASFFGGGPGKRYCSKINMNANNGLGQVLERNVVLDTLWRIKCRLLR